MYKDTRICPEYSNEELGEIIKKRERKMVTTVDIEGDPHNGYWYVCDECHGAVDTKDKICPHCKSPLDWSGALWKRVSQ